MAAELKVGIGAETDELKAGLKDAEAQIKKFLDNVVTIGKVGEKLQSIGTKLSVGLTAPIVGLSTVALKAFSDLEGVRIAFNRLNDPKLLDNLRKATKGTTSDLELMQAAVKSEKFGLSTNALPTLLEYAGRVAKDTGQEVSYLVDSITTGIGRKSPLILDNLGISASQLKAELGGVSMEAASVAMVTEAVGRIAAKELAKMGKDTKTLSESWLQVKTSINNSMGKIGEIISKNLDISGIIDKLTGYINKAVSAFENLSPGIQKAILVVVGLVAAAGPLLAIVGSILAVLPSVVAGFGLFSVALTALTGPIGLVVLGIGAIIAAVVSNWDKIKPYIINSINWFRNLYNESLVVRTGIVGIAVIFKNTFAVVANILKTAYEVFKSFAKATADIFSGIGSVIKGVFTGDFKEIGSGLAKIGYSITNGILDIKNDSIKGFNDLFTDIKTNLMGGLSSILNDGKLKPITDLKIFDTNKIAEKAELSIDKVAEKLKNKKKEKIAVVEIEPIDQSFLEKSYKDSLKQAYLYTSALKSLAENSLDDVMEVFINNPMNDIQASFTNGILSVMDGLSSLSDFGNTLANSLDLAFDSVVNTITDSFSSIGEAMATGGNIFEAAGGAILSGIGSFLGELGKQMVQYGVAALAMAVLSKMLLNPITAIPAAVAMIAAGAALSLASGAIKGTLKGGASSNAGGTVSSGGGGSSNYSSSFSSGGGYGSGTVVFEISGQNLRGVLNRVDDKNLRIGG